MDSVRSHNLKKLKYDPKEIQSSLGLSFDIVARNAEKYIMPQPPVILTLPTV